jgi:hypothetical protein
MDEKNRAHLLMGIALGLLLMDIALARKFLFKSLWRSFYASVAFWLVLHVPQIPRALQECRPAGIPVTHIAIKTAVFGATWWKPAAKGILR